MKTGLDVITSHTITKLATTGHLTLAMANEIGADGRFGQLRQIGVSLILLP
jgi:hypothetical protein